MRDTRTAAMAYEENWVAISAELKKLRSGLMKHRREQARAPRDWGNVGDLSHVLELVKQASSFILNEEE